MASGGVFQIVTNDGKADKMIFATEMLELRISRIREDNKKEAVSRGLDLTKVDVEPSLNQISESHLLYFHTKYKPIVPLAMEYQKLPPTSGGGNFGSTITFSLAQFGDFYIDMAVNLVLSPANAAPAPVPALPVNPANIIAAVDQTNTSFKTGSGVTISQIDPTEQVIRDFEYLGHFQPNGKTVTPGTQMQDNVYYCDFPGERIFKKVTFTINGNPIDDYGKYSYVFHRQFKILPHKLQGYYRCVGQELPVQAVTSPFLEGVRHSSSILNGPQTPKQQQPALTIWQRLLFWFNLNFSLAFPSAAVPFGQRFINIDLEEVQQLLFRAPALYTVVRVTNKYVPGTNFILANNGTYNLSGGISPVQNTWYEYYQLPVLTNGTINMPKIQDLNLYANNVFVHPWVHTIFIKRIGFCLIRLHKQQTQSVAQSQMNLLLSQFKFPIEYIYVGIIPDDNITGDWQATDWHQFAKVTHYESKGSIFLTNDANSVFGNDRIKWTEQQRTIETLEIKAHGNIIYQQTDASFYNNYTPFAFGEQTIVTPSQQGALFVNFALYPGVFQPSGHINVSRAREFYLNFTSKVIGAPGVNSAATQGTLVAEGTAMNFLLVSDGSAALRYGT